MNAIFPFLLSSVTLLTALRGEAPIVLAAEDDWYPYSAKVGATVQGFAPEIISAAYAAAGAKVTFEVVPFSRAMAGVKAGTYPGCFDAGDYENLRGDYLIPREPLAWSEQTVWGHPTAPPVTSYKDLEGKTVGIVNGYTYSPLLTSNGKIRKDTAPLEISSLLKVAAGRIDCTIVDRWVAKHLISSRKSELNGKVKPLGVLQSDRIIPVFSKAHPDGARARDLYDKGMEIIRKNGVLDGIMKGWEAKIP